MAGNFFMLGCEYFGFNVIPRIPADCLFAVDNSTFNNISPNSVLYVPCGAKQAYENTFGWNRFDRIMEY